MRDDDDDTGKVVCSRTQQDGTKNSIETPVNAQQIHELLASAKEEGNKWFRQKKFKRAAKSYKDGLLNVSLRGFSVRTVVHHFKSKTIDAPSKAKHDDCLKLLYSMGLEETQSIMFLMCILSTNCALAYLKDVGNNTSLRCAEEQLTIAIELSLAIVRSWGKYEVSSHVKYKPSQEDVLNVLQRQQKALFLRGKAFKLLNNPEKAKEDIGHQC